MKAEVTEHGLGASYRNLYRSGYDGFTRYSDKLSTGVKKDGCSVVDEALVRR